MWTTRLVILPRLALMLAVLVLVLGFVSPCPLWAQANLENPTSGSFQSGIGVISGWKCTAGTVTITVDNGPPAQAAYGTSRADTKAVCGGKTNTGFGLLFNWNLLGNGQHTLRAFDNGVQFASATFTVTTLGQEFLKGQSGSTTLNFAGKSVTLTWQESQQNFVITSAASAGLLYTGVTSQGTTCSAPFNPSGSCHARFNMATTRDQLIPSSLVDQVLTQHPCSGGMAFLFVASCGSTVTAGFTCNTVPVTSGHWERHATFSDGSSFNIVANCTGNTCSGTNDATTVSPSCSTGTLTWTATTTGTAAAAAEEEAMQSLEGIEGYGQLPKGVQIETNEDGDVLIIAP
jgi:hypothetical protein